MTDVTIGPPSRLRVIVPDEETLRATLERLDREAPSARVVELRSNAPLREDLADRVPTRRSRAPLFGLAGGAIGALAGLFLAVFTAKAYPLVTGHMAIVAAPTTGIVMYEGIGAGAVLATTVCVIIEGGLARRRRYRPVDDVLLGDAIELTVEPGAGSDEADLRRLLKTRAAGAPAPPPLP